jgi:hypothetical protein
MRLLQYMLLLSPRVAVLLRMLHLMHISRSLLLLLLLLLTFLISCFGLLTLCCKHREHVVTRDPSTCMPAHYLISQLSVSLHLLCCSSTAATAAAAAVASLPLLRGCGSPLIQLHLLQLPLQ